MKLFLQTVAEQADLRQLVTQNESDFSRNRKLNFQRLVGLLINMPKRSLSIEIQEFFEQVLQGQSGACTKSAFSLQRTKLQPLFLQVWNKWLTDLFYLHYGSHARRWKGFVLQAVDGSTAYLLNTPPIVAHFGSHGNHHTQVAMGRILQIHDVLNDLIIWGGIYPIAKTEPTLLAEEVERLPIDSVTLFDRGFAGFGLMYLMMHQESPRHFVIRCKTNHSKSVAAFSRSSNKSSVIELKPCYRAIALLRSHGYIISAQTTLQVRAVQVNLPTGEQEILLTNLYDPQLYPTAEMKQLYGLRWGIETCLYKQKNQQQLEQFSGHRVICIQQDYAATLLVANLQSLIEKQCTAYLERVGQGRMHHYKINRNVSWASLKHKLIALFITEQAEPILLQLQQAFEKNIEPVRPGRKYQRTRKARRLTGKYQTFTNYKRAV